MSKSEEPQKMTRLQKMKGTISELKKCVLLWIRSTMSELRSISLWKISQDYSKYFISSIAIPLYPLAVFLVLLYFLSSPSRGGTIRKAEATEDHPTIVRLAKGRRTAIHFWEKPERVIPGSPSKVQIDFLGNDVTVSPLANDPGNLLVYARGTRFVVLFQMASEANYDDVVQLVPGRSKTIQAIRLDQDTYRLATFKVVRQQRGVKSESEVQALLKNGGKLAVIEDLSPMDDIRTIKCGRCVYSRSDTTFVCPTSIDKIDCKGSGGFKLSLQKVSE